MKLFFQKLGKGKPLIILHGLFGMSDNWLSMGRKFAEHFEVYLVDQRNHGRSPHDDCHDYASMSADLWELIQDNNIKNPTIIGHSMGGKTAMFFASQFPEVPEKLIIIDIGPKHYYIPERPMLDAMLAVDLSVKTRKEAEEQLKQLLNEPRFQAFLAKNICWKGNGKLGWKLNLKTLDLYNHRIGDEIIFEKAFLNPVLFLRGAQSDFILPEDEVCLKRTFPNSKIVTIENAGHWVQVDQPEVIYRAIIEFVSKKNIP